MMRLILCATVFVPFLACKTPGRSTLSQVIGEDGRVSETDPSLLAAIGALTRDGNPFCTAFVVDDDEILTAAHCLETVDRRSKLTFVTAAGELDVAPSPREVHPLSDVARLRLAAPAAGKLPLAARWKPASGATLTSFDLRKNKLVRSGDGEVRAFEDGGEKRAGVFAHSFDTVPGASGAPILHGGEVVAIHLGAVTVGGTPWNYAVAIESVATADVSGIGSSENGVVAKAAIEFAKSQIVGGYFSHMTGRLKEGFTVWIDDMEARKAQYRADALRNQQAAELKAYFDGLSAQIYGVEPTVRHVIDLGKGAVAEVELGRGAFPPDAARGSSSRAWRQVGERWCSGSTCAESESYLVFQEAAAASMVSSIALQFDVQLGRSPIGRETLHALQAFVRPDGARTFNQSVTTGERIVYEVGSCNAGDRTIQCRNSPATGDVSCTCARPTSTLGTITSFVPIEARHVRGIVRTLGGGLNADAVKLDFDGDGRADVFAVGEGGRWYMSPGGNESWRPMAIDAGRTLPDLRFGDFDRDGKTDVFSIRSDGRWQFSSGGVGSWQTLGIDHRIIEHLRFGDFDGDGYTDVFTVTPDGGWHIAYQGRQAWKRVAQAGLTLAELRFSDFDGDGATDVFAVLPGGQWVVSRSGSSNFQNLGREPAMTIADLALGDFDGDGRADVFAVDATGQWLWSRFGTASWTPLGVKDDRGLGELRFADVDGDGKTDVFARAPGGRWLKSSAARTAWVEMASDPGKYLHELHVGTRK